MTKVVIDGKEYCAETLLYEVKRLEKEVIASKKLHKMELEDIKAEIKQGISHFANENGDITYGLYIAENIIDKHISGKGNK